MATVGFSAAGIAKDPVIRLRKFRAIGLPALMWTRSLRPRGYSLRPSTRAKNNVIATRSLLCGFPPSMSSGLHESLYGAATQPSYLRLFRAPQLSQHQITSHD